VKIVSALACRLAPTSRGSLASGGFASSRLTPSGSGPLTCGGFASSRLALSGRGTFTGCSLASSRLAARRRLLCTGCRLPSTRGLGTGGRFTSCGLSTRRFACRGLAASALLPTCRLPATGSLAGPSAIGHANSSEDLFDVAIVPNQTVTSAEEQRPSGEEQSHSCGWAIIRGDLEIE
jgi:hypothetical protein